VNFGPATTHCVEEFLLIVDFFSRMLFTTLLKRSFSISVSPRFLGPPKGGTGFIHPPPCEEESSSSEDSGGVKGAEAEVLLLQGAGADVEV